MHHYQRLCILRESQGKTQAEISKVLNMPRQQYNRYETGARELPMHHFITLAKYYNVSLDYLAGLIDTPKKLY